MKFKTTAVVTSLESDEVKVSINPDTDVEVMDVKLDENCNSGVALLIRMSGGDYSIRMWVDSSCVERVNFNI